MLLALLLSLQLPEPALWVHNPSTSPQRCIVGASLPVPRHWGARSLAGLTVGGEPARHSPQLRWPDGSLALVRVHWPAQMAAMSSRRLPVHCMPVAADPSDTNLPGDSSWPSVLPLRTEVVDPWGRVYVAHLRPVSDRWRGLVHEQEFAGAHTDAAAGTRLLGVHARLAHAAGESFGELTLALDNGRLVADGPGAVRFTGFALVTEDPRLRLRPRWAAENLLPTPSLRVGLDGKPVGYRQDLLGPSKFLYLGDGTAKTFLFDIAWDVGDAAAEAAVFELAEHPPYAFADLDWVRYTGAFGLHGGPAPLAGQLDAQAGATVGQWQRSAEFGPFGGFGAAKEAVALGSSRHGSSALHNVLRWQSADLLRVAQAQVLQSSLRPLPGHVARAHAAGDALRQGLSARAARQPHGFEALEYEGVSVDLLFDYWWLTGDSLALRELRLHATGIRRLLEHLPFMTSRGEGWCTRALVAIAWATDDRELLDWTAQRARLQVLPRLRDCDLVALGQPPHPEALGGDVWFDAPWQMAALVYALHALHRATGDDDFAEAAVEVARRMATHGWVDGTGPKYLMHATDPLTYCLPRDHGALHGTARFEIGAFVLGGEIARDRPTLQHLFSTRAAAIVTAARDGLGPVSPALRADPWLQLWIDRHERGF